MKLAQGGHHIIYSVPIYTAGSSGFTNVACQVVGRDEYATQATSLRYRKSADAPVILVLGVYGFRAIPETQFSWSSRWVMHPTSEKTLGTACLSRAAFLEGRVLNALAAVNAATTLVPQFAGVIDGEWHLQLTTWDQHEYRRHSECRWTRVQECADGYVEYEWQHRDDWAHQHEDTFGDEKSGEYRLSCKLPFPTLYSSMELMIMDRHH